MFLFLRTVIFIAVISDEILFDSIFSILGRVSQTDCSSMCCQSHSVAFKGEEAIHPYDLCSRIGG